MKIIKTDFDNLFIIEPAVHTNQSGFFFESYNKQALKKLGITTEFVQDNQARSNRNVIRGLHYQLPPFSQTKLVRALHGRILDVVLDLRRDQLTYGKIFSIELSAENKLQLFIPQGFAHGYSVLSESSEIHYKCDNYYNPQFERGIRCDDPALAIDWKTDRTLATISPKDKALPEMSSAEIVF